MNDEREATKKLTELLSNLDESAQEERAERHSGSIFQNAPDDETIVQRAREFDDIPKHWVRRELWLKTVKQVLKTKKGSPKIRLLTLPGRNLFEVKLYEKEGLLDRVVVDGEERLAVVGFESDPSVLGLQLTARPRLLEMLQGDILDALADSGTVNGRAIRRHAPYDVINLDLTGNIATPHDGPYSPFFKGVRECFQLQGPRSEPWALMVTFRAGLSDVEPNVLKDLQECLQENLAQHLQVREAVMKRYRVRTAKEILEKTPEEGLGQFTAKWIVEQGHTFEWESTHYRHASYNRAFTHAGRNGQYSLRKLVFVFTKHPSSRDHLPIRGVPSQAWHGENLRQLFDQAANVDVDGAVKTIRSEYRVRLADEIQELLRIRGTIEDAT